MTVSRSSNSKNNIVNFPSPSISAQIQCEKIRLINSRARTKSPEETLKMFADVLELNVAYLADQQHPENAPVIESMIDIVARLRAWLD